MNQEKKLEETQDLQRRVEILEIRLRSLEKRFANLSRRANRNDKISQNKVDIW